MDDDATTKKLEAEPLNTSQIGISPAMQSEVSLDRMNEIRDRLEELYRWRKSRDANSTNMAGQA